MALSGPGRQRGREGGQEAQETNDGVRKMSVPLAGAQGQQDFLPEFVPELLKV